jgi:hypothetical protein
MVPVRAADASIMRSGAFQAGALLAALIMATFVALEGENLGKELGIVEEDAVLVFVVPLPENARRIRAAVSKDRVVWEGEAGFALDGERVVTPSYDQAGDVIMAAGWTDRPIKIISLEVDPSEESDGDSESPASRAERADRLRSLVKKPTLSRGEQMFILKAMNDGIEI